jgi:hypothetical protein
MIKPSQIRGWLAMQGDRVIVRACGGIPLIRRVWEETESKVYITDDSHFERLLAGDEEVYPIGFPREDVFRYELALATRVDNPQKTNKWDWSKLENLV